MAKRRPLPSDAPRPSRAERFAARQASLSVVTRPFEGLKSEADLVCLREIVPSATTVVKLKDGREATLGTVVPLTWPAMKRTDGQSLLALQTPQRGLDVSQDLAAALLAVLDAEEGTDFSNIGSPPADGARLQDLLVDEALEITCHSGFDWWLPEAAEVGSPAAEAMAAANADVIPTERLSSVEAAYWCHIGDKAHLRWAMTQPEETVLDGLARLKATGDLSLGEGSRFIGSFRALGIVVPVWDVAFEATAESLNEPVAAVRTKLSEAMAVTAALTSDERRARNEISSRQLTLR